MKDFDKKLLEHKKRHDTNFTKDQLKKHLIECLSLLDATDQHVYAELVDLTQITKVFLAQNFHGNDLEALVKQRYDKFMSKIDQDK